jgi:hypothetical protein
MLADEEFRAVVAATTASPGGTNLFNVTVPICLSTAVLPNCDTGTLITDTTTPALLTGGTPLNYLWADDQRLSPEGQFLLGSLAITALNRTPL